jgi:hypothetical protein
MVGIVVDAGRMHLTKQNWDELLEYFREETRREIFVSFIRETSTPEMACGAVLVDGTDGR